MAPLEHFLSEKGGRCSASYIGLLFLSSLNMAKIKGRLGSRELPGQSPRYHGGPLGVSDTPGVGTVFTSFPEARPVVFPFILLRSPSASQLRSVQFKTQPCAKITIEYSLGSCTTFPTWYQLSLTKRVQLLTAIYW